MGTSEYRILLLEDDQDASAFMLRAFEKADPRCVVRTLPDGAAAIDHLAECLQGAATLPALVITDLKMPRKNGFDVLAWVRNQHPLSKLPVVVLTSSSEPSDLDRATRLGATAYFEKPFTLSALVDLAKAILAGDFGYLPRNKA